MWCDEWSRIYDNLEEAHIIEINSINHDFYEINKKADPLFAAAYTRDYTTFRFEDLVNEFKEHYKFSPPQKHPFPHTFSPLHSTVILRRKEANQRTQVTNKIKKAMAALHPAVNTLVGGSAHTLFLQLSLPTGLGTPKSANNLMRLSQQILPWLDQLNQPRSV